MTQTPSLENYRNNPTQDYLNARIEALERENKRLINLIEVEG